MKEGITIKSAKGFWTMIGLTILAGIAWLAGSREIINKIMKRE